MKRTTILHDGVPYRVYDQLYAASEDGQMLKIRTMTFATPSLRSDGYLGIGRQRLVHRVVATCWVENPNDAKHVHHRNGIKSDNRAANLEWLNPKQHKAKHPGSEAYVRTELTRQKLRDYRTGKKASEETKQKQREAAIRLGCTPPPRPAGYKCSDAAIAKMRENSPNAVKCEIDGVIYSSFSAAGEALGIKPHTLRKRCYSSSFGDYRLVKG